MLRFDRLAHITHTHTHNCIRIYDRYSVTANFSAFLVPLLSFFFLYHSSVINIVVDVSLTLIIMRDIQCHVSHTRLAMCVYVLCVIDDKRSFNMLCINKHCEIFGVYSLPHFYDDSIVKFFNQKLKIENWKQYLFSIIGKIMIKGKSHTDLGSVDFNLMWFYLRYFVRKPKLFGEIGRLRSHRILSREEKRLHQSPWLIKECYNETLHRRHKKIRPGIMLQ